MLDDGGEIRDGIAAFIRKPDDGFARLAAALYSHQFATNRPYRAYCESLGIAPGDHPRWEEIPPVPADAFKTGLPLACFPVRAAARTFLTSGTTSDLRGAHYLPELETYTLSICRGWQEAGLPDIPRRLFLSSAPGTRPDSSLACMFEVLAGDDGAAGWLLDADGNPGMGELESVASESAPVILFGTSLSLLGLIELLPRPLPLPAGSWVFQTGGYKGQRREVRPTDLEGLIAAWLDIPPDRIINEYGMTELSSQSYAVGPGHPHRTPPWMRVRVIDPETGGAQPPGAAGYLVFYDLANVGSVLAVRTQDFGRAVDERTFHLDGRDPGALPRGCSRASEAVLPPASPS